MKTTILYFHRLHFPSSSGQTIQVIRDYRGMSVHHRVHLFYRGACELSCDEQERLLREHGVTLSPSFTMTLARDGFASGYWFRRQVQQLARASVVNSPVLLVTRTLDHAQHAIRFASRLNPSSVRVVLELHETAIPHLIYRQQQRRLRAWLSKRAETSVFARLDGIIATVASQRDVLSRLFPNHAPIIVLPNSYQPGDPLPETGQPTRKPESFSIRYAGQFSDWKNTDIVFRVLKRLPEQFILEVAGGKRGDEAQTRRRIEAVSHELGVDGRVNYVGVLGPAEVPEFLRHGDCLVLPLGDNLQSRLFTSPMKLFEYAASGRPMVVTAHPTTCSLVSEREAMMVTPGSEEAMAEAIRKIALDPEGAARMATNARQWVEQFSVATRARRYNDFINTIFSRT